MPEATDGSKEHVRACWEARLTSKHTDIRHMRERRKMREGDCVHGWEEFIESTFGRVL